MMTMMTASSYVANEEANERRNRNKKRLPRLMPQINLELEIYIPSYKNKQITHACMNLLSASSGAYIHTDQAEQSAAKALIVLGAFKSFAMREIYLIPTVQFTLVTIACVLSLSITSIRTHKLPMHTYFIPLKSRIP